MTGSHPAVAVVTDSTACLPVDLATDPARRLTVVPLAVVVNGVAGLETIDIDSATVAEALNARRVAVTTSRPSPEAFADVYRRLLDAGAPAVLSVHLSAKLSGTYDAAVLAAAEFDGAVSVIDTQSTGMGLGFPALAAASAAASGAGLDEVRQAALDAVDRTSTLFYVDTLEFLRRGGRIGAAAALLGTALSVKPILHTTEQGVVVREKVRTSSRALARLVDMADEAAGESVVDVAVHHLAAPDRADALLTTLKERLGERLRGAYLTEVGAVVGAHVGPGMVAVVVYVV
ncbi:DegV family protein [Dactylosporangium aurantiacum]|uniref:DegV family protein n=1 Tax=Dactylosporangium aurantiacum TaxID=35754 RepID=A0A9Q9IFN2_9ACTN|nr:DegV family protein [Dactylosporangium aurantiacum]MDG6108103.1 DegV family protein [Dactylosporangium aurantiacum]UWZ53733.1 DegV family protein [Dactylosporangium aurantiacum]